MTPLGANTLLALGACSAFGVLAGAVGTFVLARRRSLLADVAGHATLPGVCVAFLAGEAIGLGGRNPLVLLVGGASTALLAAWSVPALARLRGVGADGAVAVTLSFFFGLGAVLLSAVQSHPSGAQGGINGLLFGSAAGVTSGELLAMLAIAGLAIATLAMLFKELCAAAFDEPHARALGLPVRGLDLALTALLVATVVAGMQVAGIVLVVSMLTAPAAAARLLRGGIVRVIVIASSIGAATAAAGVLASRIAPTLPTGSAMTLAATAVFAIVLVATRGRRSAA